MTRRICAAWARVPAKMKARAARIIRLFVVALVAQAPAVFKAHEPVTWSVICGLIFSAGETAWQEYSAARTAKKTAGA